MAAPTKTTSITETDTEEVKILHISLEEQRRLYDNTGHIYDQLRIKSLTLIAGEVAIVTFLFTGWNVHKVLVGSDRIFFLFAGIILMAMAFTLLLWTISTVSWKMAHDFSKAQQWFVDKNRNTERAFLEYLHDDYCHVNAECLKIVSSRCTKFNWSLFMLSAGVIMVMVIKFGGPQ